MQAQSWHRKNNWGEKKEQPAATATATATAAAAMTTEATTIVTAKAAVQSK